MRGSLVLVSLLTVLQRGLATPLVHAEASKVYQEEVPRDFQGSKHLRAVLEKRANPPPSFTNGQPYDPVASKGSIFSGGTNAQLDIQNPANLGAEGTDNGVVVNLKWSFSDSKARLLNGGWSREQVLISPFQAKAED